MRLVVAQPTSDRQGHFGPWTAELCQALVGQDHEVILVTNRFRASDLTDSVPKFEIVETFGGRLAFEKADNAFASHRLRFYRIYLRNCLVILANALWISRRRCADGVFITDTEGTIAALLLLLFARKLAPVVMEVRATNFTYGTYDGLLLEKACKVVQREVLRGVIGRQVRAIAVLGETARAGMRRQLRVPEQVPIEVVCDGVMARALPARDAARSAIGLNYPGPVFLFFGVWRREKGLDNLIEAVAAMSDQEFRLVVAGAPRDYDADVLERSLIERGLDRHVILRPGYLAEQDIPNYVRACDALVLPYDSSYRGGSGPLLSQACAYGRPALVSDVGEMSRLVRERGMGLVFEPDSASAATDALCRFLALSNDRRSDMESAAGELGAENSWDAVAGRLSDLFTALRDQS